MEDDLQNDDDWPAFEVPADVTRDDSSAGNEPPATPPATPPAAPATPPAQPPAATPPATPTGGAPAGGDETVPKYRLDEVIADRNADRAQIAALTEIVKRLQGNPPATPPADPAAPAPLSPEDQKVRDRLLQVIPELALLGDLKDLAAKKGAVLGVVDDTERWRSNEQAITESYVDRSVGTVYDGIAALLLGEGKKGTDLNEFQKEGILASMARWVQADPKRAVRYDKHDDTVVAEFVTAYKASMIDPFRRDSNAALLERAGAPPAIPAGGSTTPLTPPAPAAPNTVDEDAIHSAAWGRRGEFAGSR